MKKLFKSSRFKLIAVILALLLVGMFICAANGHGETAQSSIIGTLFTPAHWVAAKLSDGIDKISDNAKGNAQYEQKIDELQKELGELQDQLADYDNLKSQNELYKDALELKEDNPDFKFTVSVLSNLRVTCYIAELLCIDIICGNAEVRVYNRAYNTVGWISFFYNTHKVFSVKHGIAVLYTIYASLADCKLSLIHI